MKLLAAALLGICVPGAPVIVLAPAGAAPNLETVLKTIFPPAVAPLGEDHRAAHLKPEEFRTHPALLAQANAQPPPAMPLPATETTPATESEPYPEASSTPAADAAPLDIDAVKPKLRISDASLEPLLASASSPARAASLQMVEEARKQIVKGRPQEAIRALGRAISIDPTDTCAYFYLGRAWLERKDRAQALTFFKRAEIGFGSDPDWLGETLAFEGRIYEEEGNVSAAALAYQQAMVASPGNLMARVGYTRLSVESAPPEEPAGEPTSEAAPPPEEVPAPPPPPSEAPQPAN